jgi:hypothetical protein
LAIPALISVLGAYPIRALALEISA